MIHFFSRRINSKKGFTLVELLVVIAILGLLALIAIPRLGIYRKDAAEAANKASAASIYNGAQAYLAKHGNLSGFDWHDYITGAMPSDAVVGPVTEDGLGGINPVTVSTNDGSWVGVFPDGEGGGGSQTIIDVTLPRFEAEAATLIGSNVRVQSASNASGGQVVGNLNWTGDGIEITVNTTDVVAGEATLVIRYSCNLTPPGKLGLYINGARIQQISFVNTGGWNTFTTSAAIPVTLDHTLASNTVRLYRAAEDGPAIDIDYLELTVKKYE